MMVENASVFFHEGQLRGSLISSDGCGISTMSVFTLSLRRWVATMRNHNR
jgi:hypothetical protein